MNPRFFESTLSLITMLMSVDIFVDLFPKSQAQPWFNVHVIQEYLNLTEPARIIEGPQDTKAIYGEDIILFCRASGNPDPQVTFLWNSRELNPTTGDSSPGIGSNGIVVRTLPKANGLALRAKLQMSNNGDTVTCRVFNQFGTDSAKARIAVYDANEPPPKGLPKITENPTTTIGQVGDSTHLQCEVSATPSASVVWIKDTFFPIDLSEPRFRLIGSGSLVIESLLEEDSGVYECVARNIIGTTISNVGHLNVRRIEFPPTIKEIPNQVFVSPGKGTNLTCKASGFPLPLVWWATAGSAPIVPPGGSKVGFHMSNPIHYYAERALTEPQLQQATLRLTDITDQLTYICVAKNSLGIVRRNISVVVKPLPDPPTWIDARPVGGTFAVLQWKAHKVSEIESYTLTVESKEKRLGSLMDLRKQITNIFTKDFHTSLNDDSQTVTYNVTDLSPYTAYKATVQAVNRKVGLSLPSDEMDFQTAEIPPGEPPQDIRMRVSSPTSLDVTWDAPQLSNGKILGYKVYYTTRKAYPLSARQVKRTPNQKIRLEDLLPNATYIISISPYNAAGDGPMSDDHYSLILPGVPGQPPNLRAVNVEAESVQLMWTKPEVPEGEELLDYSLWYSLSNGTSGSSKEDLLVIKAEDTQTILRGLMADSNYHIRLAGRSSGGHGTKATLEFRTKEHLPDVPVGLPITVLDSTSIKVSWKAPKKRLDEVRHFKLSWEPLQKTSEGGGSYNILVDPNNLEQIYTATINDLLPRTSYRVSVMAVGPRGAGRTFEFPVVTTWIDSSAAQWPRTHLHMAVKSPWRNIGLQKLEDWVLLDQNGLSRLKIMLQTLALKRGLTMYYKYNG
ncbi:hypothetical protein Aperf_G00000082779 [Anoplocephala perfoliata]